LTVGSSVGGATVVLVVVVDVVVDVVLVDDVVVVLVGGVGGDEHVGSPVGRVPVPLLIAHVTVTVAPGVYCTTTRSSAGTPRLLSPIRASMRAVSRC
jgi:hypothetical protein